MRLQDVIDFLLVTVVFRYMFLPWLGKLCAACFKRLFIRTERELAIWLHFKNRPATKAGRLE